MNTSLPQAKIIIRDVCRKNNITIFQIRTNRSRKEYNITMDIKSTLDYNEYCNLVQEVNEELVKRSFTPSAYIKPDKNGRLVFKMKAGI